MLDNWAYLIPGAFEIPQVLISLYYLVFEVFDLSEVQYLEYANYTAIFTHSQYFVVLQYSISLALHTSHTPCFYIPSHTTNDLLFPLLRDGSISTTTLAT